MPTVFFQKSHHGVGVKEEAGPAPCPGHARLEIILEVPDRGTQLYGQKRKRGEESDLNRQFDSEGVCI